MLIIEERLLSLLVTDGDEDKLGEEHGEEYHDEVGDFGAVGLVDRESTSQSPGQSG